MFNNITSTDRILRFIAASLCVYAGIFYHPLFALLAIALFLSVATNSCLVYKMTGINHGLEEKNHFLSILPRYNPEPVLVFCDQGRLRFRNEAAQNRLPSLRSLSQLNAELSAIALIREEKEEVLRYLENEKTYQLLLRGNKHENFIMVYGFDITQIAEGEEALRNLALTDPLTQMANRKHLLRDLKDLPEESLLALIDIKNFGQINSFYGQEIGDRFLQSYGELLRTAHGQNEARLYRVQSDVFAVLGQGTGIESLQAYCTQGYISLDEMQFSLEVTIAYASNNETKLNLLTMAETALIEAKKRGLMSLSYSELGDISQRYHDNLEWSKRIKRILNKEDSAQLAAFFQPILNTRSGRIEKYETLARVVDAAEIISPAVFLDPAKQLGLLPKITLMMLEAVIVHLKQSDMEFSINITMQDLQQKDFCEQLLECLHKHELSSSRIVLEILEDEEVYAYLDIFKRLKKEGFKLAIDDFGTGYSNFAKLQQIEVDYIKIDGSLIASIATNPRHLEVVRTINRYAHSIGAKTIAEFVSTEQIAQMLKHENIDYLQGYAIGKPDALLVTEKKV